MSTYYHHIVQLVHRYLFQGCLLKQLLILNHLDYIHSIISFIFISLIIAVTNCIFHFLLLIILKVLLLHLKFLHFLANRHLSIFHPIIVISSFFQAFLSFSSLISFFSSSFSLYPQSFPESLKLLMNFASQSYSLYLQWFDSHSLMEEQLAAFIFEAFYYISYCYNYQCKGLKLRFVASSDQ
jgi:hypothetical protein